MEKKYLYSLILMVLFLCIGKSNLMAQETGEISGKVVDAKGEGMIGVVIRVEGTQLGAATDIEGNYKISKVPAGDKTLIFNFIGYSQTKQKITVKAGETASVTPVKMTESSEQLKEVVVVGYGTIQKRDMTGSISTIKSKEISESVVPSFDQAMQGRAAGLQVTSSDGMAGSVSKINIRGTNSIGAGSQPLYVVDGVPIASNGIGSPGLGSTTSPLADINPNDIESIDVLKDAAATAIYGSRGANGVILVTTKRGKAGKTKITANYYQGIVSIARTEDYLNASESLALRDSIAKVKKQAFDKPTTNLRDGVTRAEADSFVAAGGSTDWIDVVSRQGMVQEASLSATGGNEKTTFYIAGTYRDENGFILNNRFRRLSNKINIDHQATDKLKFGTSITLTHSINDRVRSGSGGGFGWATELNPYLPVYKPDQKTYAMDWNPLWHLKDHKFEVKTYRTVSNLYAEYALIPGLTLRSQFGVDLLNQNEDIFEFRNVQVPTSASSAADKRTTVVGWTTTNSVSYLKTFKEKHNINAFLGYEVNASQTAGMGIEGSDFANDALRSPTAGNDSNITQYSYRNNYGFLSYIFRANYKYKEKYMASVSMRRDGSSKFGENNKYGNFPSIGAGWIISDEEFMKDVRYLNYLKLRTSYGLAGNASIADNASLGFWNSFPAYMGVTGIAPSTLANKNLTWEKSEQWDIGLEMGFLENRFSASVGYFYKQSKDLLLKQALPPSSGFSSIYQNVGELNNRGWEITMTTKNFTRAFEWSTDFNISFIRNEVTNTNGIEPDGFDQYSTANVGGEGRVIVGYPVGQAYVVKYGGVSQTAQEVPVYDLNGNVYAGTKGTVKIEAGQPIFYDKFGHIMTATHPDFYSHRTPMGSPNPKFFGGMTNSFKYKNFDFNFLLWFVYGNTIYNDIAKNRLGGDINLVQWREILDYWTPQNTDTDVPSLKYSTGSSVNSSRFLYDASYLRLKSINFGYNIPEKLVSKIKLGSARVYLRANNLLTWTKYPGHDPEVTSQVDPNSEAGNIAFAGPYNSTPQTRTFIAGIQIGF